MLPILHTISHYSLLCGVISPRSICKYAHNVGYRSLAMTDMNNLYGLPALLASAKIYGLKVIIAAELQGDTGPSALLYADGDIGFASLCTIISERATERSFNLVTIVSKYHSGIVVVTDDEKTAKYLLNQSRVYYRMSRPRRIPEWVKRLGIRSLIVPPAVFLSKNDIVIHRLLQAIHDSTTVSRIDTVDCYPDDAFFMSPQQLHSRFELFEEAVESTKSFGETISPYTSIAIRKMPQFPDNAPDKLLRMKTFEGARRRYGNINHCIRKRIEMELETIMVKGFAGYFLIVNDIVAQSPRTCGRGSAAASIVAYCLGITNVDPLRYNLMFERFLNPGRNDPPDIDIDFAWDERDGILDYVINTYGKHHAAMVATHQTYGIRMAIRDVARVHGLTEKEISEVTKKIPWIVNIAEYTHDLANALRNWPAFHHAHFDPPWDTILHDAGKIIGFPRGIGTHCGGIIITPCAIKTAAPVQISAKGYPVIQWEKDGAEAMGLVKIDLLGNRSLAVIRDTIRSLADDGIIFDEQSWDPQSDITTQTLLADGKTIGVFYVESPAMRLLQQKSKKGDFEHLVIHSSIIRPAANKFIHLYLERLHGKPFQPIHPLIADELAETFGIMVYQEDVTKVAMALAGFTLEEADKLRKIVTKKGRGETFDTYKDLFINGALKNGVTIEVINEVWQMMLSFAGYSFCKPHSASYVQVSFQSAYLKAHYPAYFMAAVLSNYGGFYTTQAYISEAMRLGINIISPDVNKSMIQYRARTNEILVGLCQIKGLSHTAQDIIIEERNGQGTYRSLIELLDRTRIDELDAEKLIFSGACDSINPAVSRPELFWTLRVWYRSAKNSDAPPLRQLSREQFLLSQYQTLGYLTECHPLSLIRVRSNRPVLRAYQVNFLNGKNVALFGWCVTSKTVSAKTGESMEFVTFEDETGIVETVFFPEIFKKYSLLLTWQTAFLIKGRVTEEFGVTVIEVTYIERLY